MVTTERGELGRDGSWGNRARRQARRRSVFLGPLHRWGLLALLGGLPQGCMDRPPIPGDISETSQLARVDLGAFQDVDLLFVVDDSASMGEKQRILAESIARGLAEPRCRDRKSGKMIDVTAEGETPASAACVALGGLRIGLISTSLEAGGSEQCAANNRGARLIPLPNGDPFWDFDSGLDDPMLGQWLASVGESGCGMEAPLEAMYRFLVDPEPPAQVQVTGEGPERRTAASGVDQVLLAEREAFLRPGSALLIVILSDEDDCSVLDTGAGYRVGQDAMPPATGSCAVNPDDACCRSCATLEVTPPEGCAALAEEPSCQTASLSASDDPAELRCFEQKRRFGQSLLFPVERYQRALTALTIVDRSGQEVPNPLFVAGRTPELIRLGVLVGMPWSLSASGETLDDPSALGLLSSAQLQAQGRWATIVGDATGQLDAHLVQSVQPRAALPGPASAHDADPVHGHEYDNPHQAGLQFACTFSLPEPIACTDAQTCDCAPVRWEDGSLEPLSFSNPVCQGPDDAFGSTQYAGKAYPGGRLLEVAGAVNGIAGSICPKTLDPKMKHSSAFGYNAMFRSSDLLAGAQGTVCIEQRWPTSAAARSQCKLIEVAPQPSSCDFGGRKAAPRDVARSLVPPGAEFDDYVYCELPPAAGDQEEPGTAAYSCAHDFSPAANTWGYCFIDADRGLGSAALVQMCPEQAQRRVRTYPLGLGRDLTRFDEIRYRLVCPDVP